MGCGHSKINIYPKRNRNKNATAKKTVTPEKSEAVEEEADATTGIGVDTSANGVGGCDEKNGGLDDADKKTIKVKPYGGPLIAHPELSASQNNFFKMLDEKIENGPDYDSSSENEKAMERERITSLMKDWETASAGSRSLPATPKRRPPAVAIKQQQPPLASSVEQQRAFNQSLVHQSYGVTPYRQAYTTPLYQPTAALLHHQQQQQQQPQQMVHPAAQYSSAMQYQALSSLYATGGRQYSTQQQQAQHAALLGSSPVKSYSANASPKHIPSYPPPDVAVAAAASVGAPPYSPKMYKSAAQRLSNGELIQQQIYQQQLQYQQAREYQQYKATREQQLIQHHHHHQQQQQAQAVQQQQQQQQVQAPGYPAAGSRSYQSSIHIPIVQNDIAQYDLTS